MMKNVITMGLMFALAVMVGCQSSSPRGGGMTKEVGFKITVPSFNTEIKQGQIQSVTVSLDRGDYFKQNVTLEIEVPAGLSINPTRVMIKASDNPEVQLRITATQNAAFGEYRVAVRGIPETGEPTSTSFKVKVVTK